MNATRRWPWPLGWTLAVAAAFGGGVALERWAARQAPAPMAITCPCPEAEADAWSEGGRLHLACLCPGAPR